MHTHMMYKYKNHLNNMIMKKKQSLISHLEQTTDKCMYTYVQAHIYVQQEINNSCVCTCIELHPKALRVAKCRTSKVIEQ